MSSTRVYIGRLARDATRRDLERLFKGYGDIREVNVKTGFGFVEFADERDAKDVVYDFHGKNFLGERLDEKSLYKGYFILIDLLPSID
jgi:arginine/serine-rich splicing factor 4/5/6